MKDRISDILGKIGRDKYYHFLIGFVLYLVGVLLLDEHLSLVGVITAAIFGEIKDHLTEGNKFDLLDVVATVLPAILMYCIL